METDPDAPPAEGDAPGVTIRTLVARGVGEPLASLDGSIAVIERGDDPGPESRLPALVADGASVVGVVPRIEPSLARRLIGGGVADDFGGANAEIRLVFTGPAADHLTSPSGAAIRAILANRGVDAYVHEGDSPVGILLVGDRVVVGLFDDDGIAALLWSDASAVREWAAATCRRYFSAADRA